MSILSPFLFIPRFGSEATGWTITLSPTIIIPVKYRFLSIPNWTHRWSDMLSTQWRGHIGKLSIVKRIIDTTGFFIGLLLLLPVFFLVAVAIKVDSPGPILYRQERVG